MKLQVAIVFLAAIVGSIQSFTAVAAATKTVKGFYRYYVPRHVSRDQAEQTALERAMIVAIANEFGTVMSQNTRLTTQSNKSGESVDFYSSATSLVKGEWVETIGQPKFDITLDDGEIVVSCEVSGKARGIERAQAQLDVRILRNEGGDEAESSSFLSGDKCFLAFTTPVDGYLTVYLEDEDRQVYRMLPFHSQKNTTHKVEANKRYLFFSSTAGDSEQYRLTASKDTERNTIYVIFSPNEYVKPIDRSGAEELSLRELTSDEFRRWIEKTRSLDNQLQVIARPITISQPTE